MENGYRVRRIKQVAIVNCMHDRNFFTLSLHIWKSVAIIRQRNFVICYKRAQEKKILIVYMHSALEVSKWQSIFNAFIYELFDWNTRTCERTRQSENTRYNCIIISIIYKTKRRSKIYTVHIHTHFILLIESHHNVSFRSKLLTTHVDYNLINNSCVQRGTHVISLLVSK